MEEIINLPQKIVIDASIALAFLLPDEQKNKVDYLFTSQVQQRVKIFVPQIFYFEVFNGLRSAVIRKRISSKLANTLLKSFLKINLQVEKIDWLDCFRLAFQKKTSFYDASYLCLSQKEKIPLFTLDELLRRAKKNSN